MPTQIGKRQKKNGKKKLACRRDTAAKKAYRPTKHAWNNTGDRKKFKVEKL